MTTGRALCATEIRWTGDLWFSTDPADREQAKRICRRCPLLTSCATTALANPTVRGVWGAMSAGDRRTRRTGQAGPDPDNEREGGVPVLAPRRPCGSESAWKAHARYEETCEECQAAHDARVAAHRRVLLREHHARGGTEAGAILHRRLGEKPCESCRAASARAGAERRARPARAGLVVVPGGAGPGGVMAGAEAAA